MSSLLLPKGIAAEQLTQPLEVCERIASKDRSNLYLVSQFFEERARYDAFIAMYAVMRLIDDLVDDVTDKTRLSQTAHDDLLRQLDVWEQRIRAAYAGQLLVEPVVLALAAAVKTFPVPIELWLAFIEAMRFDVRKPRFDDFAEFLSYGDGATVAPTSIYVYLLTSRPQADGRFLVVDFDFAACGRQLGRFAYLAHILRDVRADLQVGQTGLIYLSVSDLGSHGLSETDLHTLVSGTATEEKHARWHDLVHDICARAQAMRAEGESLARSVWDSLPKDCAFIFRVIVGMYSELLDRIDADPECVLRPEPVLTDEDKHALLQAAADASGLR